MHLQRRSFVPSGMSPMLVEAGTVIGAVCGIALLAALFTIHRRRRSAATGGGDSAHARRSSAEKDYQSQQQQHGSPINLRATAAFQNIWQSVDLGRNSLPQGFVMNKDLASALNGVGPRAGSNGSMSPPSSSSVAAGGAAAAAAATAGGEMTHSASDSSGSSTAVASNGHHPLQQHTTPADILLDGYTAAQGGYDPDAQPIMTAFSLHDTRVRDENTGEEGCDLGEMAVVVVAGGEEVSQVLEGMQLAEFYVQSTAGVDGIDEADVETSLVVDTSRPGTAYDSVPSPLYHDFATDRW